MRKTILTVMALSAAAIATMATSGPAAAYSASGRNLYCNVNPRVAFGRARRVRQPYPYY